MKNPTHTKTEITPLHGTSSSVRKRVKWFLSPRYIFQGHLFSPARIQKSTSLATHIPGAPWIASSHISLHSNSLRARRVEKNRKLLPQRVVASVYGNFGNQVLETACATYVALQTGLPNVVVKDSGVFRPGEHRLAGVTLLAPAIPLTKPRLLDLWRSFGVEGKRHWHLSGCFLLNWMDEPYVQDPETMALIFEGIRNALDLDFDGPLHGPRDVTVSFRGGDAFSSPPPSHYGQPPLSYYQFATLSSNWERVRIISDDMRNPTLVPYLKWLEEQGIAYEYLAQDWRRDVSTLYRSRAVIAPRGSFVPAVAAISPWLEEMYFFGDVNLPCPIGKVRTVQDLGGEYSRRILDGNWTGSEDQLKLMLSYPAHSLRLSD